MNTNREKEEYIEPLFYEFTIVEEAQKISALSKSVGEFLRSEGWTVNNPSITVVRSGQTMYFNLTLANIDTERSAILAYDKKTRKRLAFFQKLSVQFRTDSLQMHIRKEEEKWWSEKRSFSLKNDTIYSIHKTEPLGFSIGKIEYGPVIKKVGVVMDGFFYEDEEIPEEVTNMSWDQIPIAPSTMEYALAG